MCVYVCVCVWERECVCEKQKQHYEMGLDFIPVYKEESKVKAQFQKPH